MSRRFEGSSSTANSVFTHSLASARRIRPCPYDATALINPRSFSETPIGLSAREGALGKVVDGPDRSCHRGDHGCQTNVECSTLVAQLVRASPSVWRRDVSQAASTTVKLTHSPGPQPGDCVGGAATPWCRTGSTDRRARRRCTPDVGPTAAPGNLARSVAVLWFGGEAVAIALVCHRCTFRDQTMMDGAPFRESLPSPAVHLLRVPHRHDRPALNSNRLVDLQSGPPVPPSPVERHRHLDSSSRSKMSAWRGLAKNCRVM